MLRAYVALEFAYTESPFAMQGMVMGLNHLTTGLGALLGSALYNAVAVITDLAGNAVDTTTTTTTTTTTATVTYHYHTTTTTTTTS